jgi:hypothetical protein
MVRPNKTKLEGYMWPLDAPGGYPHALHCSRTRGPGSNPGGPTAFHIHDPPFRLVTLKAITKR